MRTVGAVAGLVLVAGLVFGGQAASPAGYPVGESVDYKIKWGPLTVGRARIDCDTVVHEGRNMVQVRITANNSLVAAPFYRVKDTVRCLIDPSTGMSILLEKDTHEGDVICRDVLRFDRSDNRAWWRSDTAGVRTNYTVAADTCDAVSFLYQLRRDRLTAGETREFRIAVDGTVHGIRVSAGKEMTHDLAGLGRTQSRCYVVEALADGLFVNKIPEEIWVSEGHVPVVTRMSLRVPLVGRVHLSLDEYRGPALVAAAAAGNIPDGPYVD